MKKNSAHYAEKKQINILLTRYPDRTSQLIRLFTRNYYTHASIGIDGPNGDFYSLVTKGFRIEQFYKHQTFRGKEIPCRLYSLDVPVRLYEKIQDELTCHLQNSDSYRYSYLGVILCLFNIPIKRKNRYFCSQFVSELLTSIMNLNKDSALYLPDDFIHMRELSLHFTGTLQELITTSG